MRSAAEISFRLRQEAANAWLWLRKPCLQLDAPSPLPGLPDPAPAFERLRSTPFSADVLGRAEQVLHHRFSILGIEIETGQEIRWRRDYVSGRETGTAFFRRIPYLDHSRAGDHKVIWELNRHQHLVLLAQAFRFSGRREFLSEIDRQLASWFEQNPFQCGINWASALEVAFRAMSWIWLWHLAGNHLSERVRSRILGGLHQHGRHLQYNLSRYFSRNTHLLGEAVALSAIGRLFPHWPQSSAWSLIGDQTVRAELDYQVLPDGAHFEQSAYYHVYALDFFLLHYLLSGRPSEFRPVLARMAEHLDALLGVPRAIPLIGDDDGGRLFHPYGVHAEYGRATIATSARVLDRKDWQYCPDDLLPQAAWWLGAAVLDEHARHAVFTPRSRTFKGSGLVEMAAGDVQVFFDAGTFGAGRGGHSHSDALSLIARRGKQEILIDAGTYTYVGDPEWRDRFRSSSAHNTIRVNGRDQAETAGPFGWRTKPGVELLHWASDEAHDYAVAECRYDGVVLRRSVFLLKPEQLLFVLDHVEAPGEPLIEQFWNFAAPGDESCLTMAGEVEITRHQSWRSRALGRKEPSFQVRAALRAASPAEIAAVLDLSGAAAVQSLYIRHTANSYTLTWIKKTGETAPPVRLAVVQ